ncbi:MAG: YbaN family protein [Pseudooceanicola sp.]|nr:YbaN family protein [Pseudooceanicola sp.]
MPVTDLPPPIRRIRPLWTLAGVVSLALGIIGIALPVMPTTPFVLLAALCFGKGSPRLHAWLLGHRYFGPMIADWEATGAIPRHIKYWACGSMAVTFAACAALGVPGRVLIAQAVLMTIGAGYVLTRPDR